MKRLIVIAGAPKAGTTSLYRYLGAAPNITPSFKKELSELNCNDFSVDKYIGNFLEGEILLESTPGYIFSPELVIENSLKVCPNVDIIFIVRDPVELFFSLYRHRKNKTNNFDSNMCFKDFLHKIFTNDHTGFKDRASFEDCKSQLDAGLYGKWIKKYSEIARGRVNILAISFEMLVSNPNQLCHSILTNLDLDPSYLSDYIFEIENKNRKYRSLFVHKLVHKIIMLSEPYLNRHPNLRRQLRRLYAVLNDSSTIESISDDERALLENYFQSDRMQLNESLQKIISYGNFR